MLQQTLAVTLCAALALPTTVIAAPPPTPPGGAAPAAGGSRGSPDSMTEAERVEVAKSLYSEADAAFQSGDFSTALTKFEEAYNVYAPSFHVFNMNIGLAAYELGDCVKAKQAFSRFLDLVPEHGSRPEAQEKVLEIDRSGCANVAPVTTAPVTTTTAPVEDDEDDAPLLTSRKDEREEAAERERTERDSKKAGPFLIAGAVLTGLGGASIIGGGISLALANRKANDLAELASPGPTGFPEGDYGDDEVFNLDRNKLPANNNATIALFVVGGVLATTGVVLLALHFTRKKKSGKGKSKNAKADEGTSVSFAPAPMRRGGGAAAFVRF